MFAGDVVSKTIYKHGSPSMEGTIIGNVNLLEPTGQFGSRYKV